MSNPSADQDIARIRSFRTKGVYAPGCGGAAVPVPDGLGVDSDRETASRDRRRYVRVLTEPDLLPVESEADECTIFAFAGALLSDGSRETLELLAARPRGSYPGGARSLAIDLLEDGLKIRLGVATPMERECYHQHTASVYMDIELSSP